MTETPNPETPPATNPPPATTPPADPPPPPATRAPSNSDNSGSVLAAVNALPERLVDAVRELIPQQQPQPQQPQQPQQQPQQPQQPPASAGSATPTKTRRSVGEWFFGIRK